MQEYCAGRLARFKRPARVLIVDELPRGATGKVQKGLLRRRLAEIDESQAGERWTTSRACWSWSATAAICARRRWRLSMRCAPRPETEYALRDVDADPELQRRYTDQVPVTFVDGRQHDVWRVDPARLAWLRSDESVLFDARTLPD